MVSLGSTAGPEAGVAGLWLGAYVLNLLQLYVVRLPILVFMCYCRYTSGIIGWLSYL